MRFLAQNWEWIAAGAYALLNLVVGRSRIPRGARPVVQALVTTLARLAVVTHHDAPGTFKLPGRRADGGRTSWAEEPR